MKNMKDMVGIKHTSVVVVNSVDNWNFDIVVITLPTIISAM